MTSDIPELDVTLTADGRVSFVHAPQARAYLRRLRQAEGEHLVLQIYPHRAKRSDRQNRAAHALCSEWLRAKQGWTLGALKLYALGQVFGYLEVPHPVTGEVLLFPAEPHTSKLSVGKFCELIDWILQAAAEEDGVVLLAPSEYLKAKESRLKHASRKNATAAAA